MTAGAIYGSLFGSLFSLVTGVGVLFVPFLGAVVAAGPLGAALLGATSGAQISPEMRANLSDEAQSTFVETYNQSLGESKDKTNALIKAWERIKHLFDRDMR